MLPGEHGWNIFPCVVLSWSESHTLAISLSSMTHFFSLWKKNDSAQQLWTASSAGELGFDDQNNHLGKPHLHEHQENRWPSLFLMDLSVCPTLKVERTVQRLAKHPETGNPLQHSQKGPPVCWLFLPGRLFLFAAWSVHTVIRLVGPSARALSPPASDKARPTYRKQEIYPQHSIIHSPSAC